MIKLTPIILAVLYGLVLYRFSVWRTKRALDENSTRSEEHTSELQSRI